MESKIVRISALLSGGLVSICCGVPLVLALIGASGIGLGAKIGQYHWFLTAGGIIAISVAWYFFRRERQKDCETCVDPENKSRLTLYLLSAATFFVLVFTVFNIYSYTSNFDTNSYFAQARGEATLIKINGMTCASCELHVEKALNKLHGVFNAKASANSGQVFVDYNKDKVSIDEIYQTIDSTGYKAIYKD